MKKIKLDVIDFISLVRKKITIIKYILLVSIFLFTLISVSYASDEELEANLVVPAPTVDGISKTIQSAEPGGGAYTVDVTLGSSLRWTASTNVSWITLSTTVGTESMTVRFNVAANNDDVAGRRGEITFVMSGKSYKLAVLQKRLVVWPVGTYNRATGIHTATEPSGDELGDLLSPSKGTVVTGVGDITSFYGARVTSTNSRYKRHWAIDIDVGTSTNIKAMAAMSGTVSEVGLHPDWGNYVIIEHKVGKTELRTKYFHLKSYSVSKGNKVNAGTQIGIVGGTGTANGDLHLHFDLQKKVDKAFYSVNSVPYYHGSDDRGVTKSAYNASGLKVWSNNPLYVVGSDGKWKPNPSCNLSYSAVAGSGDFYKLYMNAHRRENVIEIAKQEVEQ